MATAVITISAEIESSRFRLGEVLDRIEVAEKAAEKQKSFIRNRNANIQRSNNGQDRKTPFGYSLDEENHFDTSQVQQGWTFLCQAI